MKAAETGAQVSTTLAAPEPIHTNGLLTPDQVAERWQVGKAQVYRLARDGRVPAVRLGRYVRFRVGDLEAFERDGGVSG